MSRTAEQARALFAEGFSCSQAVLAAMAPRRDLDRDAALRVAAALGGGMARSGGPCGAVTGALMAIGLEHGSAVSRDRRARTRCYDLGEEFLRRFRAREGATDCRDLLGHDLSKPGGEARARREGLFDSVCPRLVAAAAEIVEALLAERPGARTPVSQDDQE